MVKSKTNLVDLLYKGKTFDNSNCSKFSNAVFKSVMPLNACVEKS